MEATPIIKELLSMEAMATTCIGEFQKIKQRCYLLRRELEDSSSASAEQESEAEEMAEVVLKARLGLRTRTNRRILK